MVCFEANILHGPFFLSGTDSIHTSVCLSGFWFPVVSPVLNKGNTERNYVPDSSPVFSACLYLTEKHLDITNSPDGNLEHPCPHKMEDGSSSEFSYLNLKI